MEIKKVICSSLLCGVTFTSFRAFFNLLSESEMLVPKRAMALRAGRATLVYLSYWSQSSPCCQGVIVSMQKPWSPWHKRLLLEVAPTLTIFNALMSLGCRAQILLIMKSISLYNCTAADGSKQSKHHCNPYYSRSHNGNWSKCRKTSLSLSRLTFEILTLNEEHIPPR